MNYKRLFVCMTMFGLVCSSAFAADTLLGAAIYATGNWTEPAWSPGEGGVPGSGSAESTRLYDDGATNGDAVADDGIWTVVASGLNSGQEIEWKVASEGFSTINAPSSDTNLRLTVPEGGEVTFILDTNTYDDGLSPDTEEGPTVNGFPYSPSLALHIAEADSVTLTGSFQGQLGGSDWSPDNPDGQIELKDDGVAPDEVGGDDIYTASVTGLTAGTYAFKGVINLEGWDTAKFTNLGFITNGGGNLEFPVGAESDLVILKLDARTSRIGGVNQDFNPVPGPPWFAHSDDWGLVFGDLEQMTAKADGTFRKVFTVASAGEHEVRIRDQAGAQFPKSNNYPFSTSVDNQDVLVIFDSTEHSDPYFPQKNIVYVVDAATGGALNEWEYVQPVGDWMEDFGGGNWTTDDEQFEAFDSGSLDLDGDHVAGDGIYAIKIDAIAANTDRSLKAVGLRLGLGDAAWAIQFGGPDDGLTITGDNSTAKFGYAEGETVTFQIDTITGRMGAGTSLPERPALDVEDASAVDHWFLY